MPQRIQIPTAWQTTDPKTRDDFRRVRVALEQLAQRQGSGGGVDQVARDAAAAAQGDIDAHEGTGGTAHALVTPTEAGFMSGPDKAKLDMLTPGGGGGWTVADNIDPLHYYLASDSVQSGGFVDQLNDTGRVPKHLTQSGSLRAPLGTDSNGKVYLALDGSGKRYTAGVQSDWKFLSDGTPWTLGLVMQRTPKQTTANVWECMLATMNWATGSPGMFIAMMLNPSGLIGGPSAYHVLECGMTPFALMYLSILQPNITDGIWVLTVVHHGQTMQPGSNGLGWTAFATPCRSRSASFLKNGVMMADCNSSPSLSHNPSNPAGPLTLGAFADANTPSAARIFELMIEDRALPTDDVHAYAQDAAARFAFTL